MGRAIKPPRSTLILASALVAVSCSVAWACQYTVRDIGFVDLRGKEYTLVVRSSGHSRDSLGDWSFVDDTNVKLLFDSDKAGSVSGGKESPTDDATRIVVELVGSDGRRLSVGSYLASDADVATQVKSVLFDSNTTAKLREQAVESFAQILILQSPSNSEAGSANDEVNEKIARALAAIKRIEPMLPRPLARPIEVISIAGEQRDAEHVLEWALGIEADRRELPAVAVIYGRSKLAGKVLIGDQIETREILAQLALIGESCECETDRSWTELDVLPSLWPAPLRQQTAATLGFDPESPLVRAEVERIVHRGPGEANRGEGRRGGVDQIEQLLLGYDERTVDTVTGKSSSPGSSEAGSILGSSAVSDTEQGLIALVETGDGWGFGSDSDRPLGQAEIEPDQAEKTEAKQPQTEQAGIAREPKSVAGKATNESLRVDEPSMASKSGNRGIPLLVIVLGSMAGFFVAAAMLMLWLLKA